MIPWFPYVILLSNVICDPATGTNLFCAYGLSICLILSPNAPVQFTTYLAFTRTSSFDNLSLKTTPVIFPC
jgi:hypothetical protein